MLRSIDVQFEAPVSFELREGENVAVVGPNGAGKSLFVEMIMGRYPLRRGTLEFDFYPAESNAVYRNVRYVSFRDAYGAAETGYYYQQRWNAHDQEGVPLVRDLLNCDCDKAWMEKVLTMLGLEPLMDSLIIMLSSGELRKFQIARMLLDSPRLLIIDNPFIGLDVSMRALLNDILSKVVAEGGVQLMLILSDADEIPQYINRVVPVRDMRVGEAVERGIYLRDAAGMQSDADDTPVDMFLARMNELPAATDSFDGQEIVALKNVSVSYGNRTILKNLDWSVRCGEVWALTGCNGSGKSTLLSLLCADNLQSYACDITLFGRRRGSGESIWDIKKHIGYVCPEMHRAYMRNIPVEDIVASGLHDSIGLYVKSTGEQMAVCRWWMQLFDITHLHGRSFMQLSSGEQRLVLLARAFVKDPLLLILDEPLHGLDARNKRRVKAVVEAFSQRKGKSVIYVSHYEDEFPGTLTHRLRLSMNR